MPDVVVYPADEDEVARVVALAVERDLVLIPAARGHEYIRVSDRGRRTKLGIDATVPFDHHGRA